MIKDNYYEDLQDNIRELSRDYVMVPRLDLDIIIEQARKVEFCEKEISRLERENKRLREII